MAWITTANVSSEAWRYVMEFANLDLALDALALRHGKPTRDQKRNFRKQAQQIRAALIQASEYFDAARTASLATSPNHLYYGMVSLSTAIMLLYGDGDKSLDRLRKLKASNHHGLDFTTNATATNCHQGMLLLKESRVTPRANGHFLNWYSTLPTHVPLYSQVSFQRGRMTNTRREQAGTENCATPAELVTRSWTLLDLLLYLPDLRNNLLRYQESCPCSRMSYTITVKLDSAGRPREQDHYWRIHGADSHDDLLHILNQFRVPACNAGSFNCDIHAGASSCTVTFHRKADDVGLPGKPLFQYPSMRVDMNQESYAFAKQLDTPEFVDAYLCAFGLSMLARYFPDIWITCLDSHCRATKIIERLVDILIEKAPLTAASVLANEDLVISTQRPPWFT